MRPTVYAAISSHGFGHATRTAAVLEHLGQHLPEVRLILATTSPDWLLRSYLNHPFEPRPVSLDVGVVQPDCLGVDREATRRAVLDLQEQSTHLITQEAAFCRREGVQLVYGDMSPLAPAIARTAGVPCLMAGNFGWDFIYADWGPDFTPLIDWIRESYGQCDRLLRLPFCEPMGAFPVQADAGLTGGSPRHALEPLRSQLRLEAPPERTVLITFGGLGLQQLPYARCSEHPDWTFLSFDAQAPELPNLRRVGRDRLRPVDVMPLCSRVICKPGYGTFSEAGRLGVPLVALTREEFAEAPLLMEALPRLVPHRIVDSSDFLSRPWDWLEQPLQPQTGTAIAPDGNDTVAEAIADLLS